MSTVVIRKIFREPPIDKSEILRYAGCAEADARTGELLEECLSEIGKKCIYQVCFAELTVSLQDMLCDFGAFSVHSSHLAGNLAGCERVILFAATVGTAPDRLIQRYTRISPAKALLMQVGGQAVLGRQLIDSTPWLTERHGYDPTSSA